MSRLLPLSTGRATGHARTESDGLVSLTDAQIEFDLKLAETFVEFANGAAASVFDWVPAAQSRLASQAGHPMGFNPFPKADEATLRADAGGIAFLASHPTYLDSPPGRFPLDLAPIFDFLNRHLAQLQIVTLWRLRRDRTLEECSIPRLDSIERCFAYVLAMVLLDRHHLGRGIKACQLIETKVSALEPGGYARSGVGRLTVRMHFFLDVPNSKRIFCCPQHAATHRKRQQREKERSRTRTSRRRPKS